MCVEERFLYRRIVNGYRRVRSQGTPSISRVFVGNGTRIRTFKLLSCGCSRGASGRCPVLTSVGVWRGRRNFFRTTSGDRAILRIRVGWGLNTFSLFFLFSFVRRVIGLWGVVFTRFTTRRRGHTFGHGTLNRFGRYFVSFGTNGTRSIFVAQEDQGKFFRGFGGLRHGSFTFGN